MLTINISKWTFGSNVARRRFWVRCCAFSNVEREVAVAVAALIISTSEAGWVSDSGVGRCACMSQAVAVTQELRAPGSLFRRAICWIASLSLVMKAVWYAAAGPCSGRAEQAERKLRLHVSPAGSGCTIQPTLHPSST